MLRNALYDLRDEIRELLSVVGRLNDRFNDPKNQIDWISPIRGKTLVLTSCLSSLNDGMNLILTNNYSDWIESDIGSSRKIISYLAFTSLSPDMLRDVTGHLRHILGVLGVQSDDQVELCEGFPNNHDVHQIDYLSNVGQFDEIKNTVDFLTSLLMPETETSNL